MSDLMNLRQEEMEAESFHFQPHTVSAHSFLVRIRKQDSLPLSPLDGQY